MIATVLFYQRATEACCSTAYFIFMGMIFRWTKLKISETKEILKIGDTIADIQEGKNAKVLTAVLLSGTQSEKDLIDQEPEFVLNKLMDIKNCI